MINYHLQNHQKINILHISKILLMILRLKLIHIKQKNLNYKLFYKMYKNSIEQRQINLHKFNKKNKLLSKYLMIKETILRIIMIKLELPWNKQCLKILNL